MAPGTGCTPGQAHESKAFEAVIPPKSDQSACGGFDQKNDRRRNVIERCIGWLKCCRRIATGYEKLATHFLAMVKLAMIQRCLRILDPSNTASSHWHLGARCRKPFFDRQYGICSNGSQLR